MQIDFIEGTPNRVFLQNCSPIVSHQCGNAPRNNRHLAFGLVLRKQGFSQDQTSTGSYTALLFLVKAVQYFDYLPDKFPVLNQKTFARSVSHRSCLHGHTHQLSNLNSILKYTAFCYGGIPFTLSGRRVSIEVDTSRSKESTFWKSRID